MHIMARFHFLERTSQRPCHVIYKKRNQIRQHKVWDLVFLGFSKNSDVHSTAAHQASSDNERFGFLCEFRALSVGDLGATFYDF